MYCGESSVAPCVTATSWVSHSRSSTSWSRRWWWRWARPIRSCREQPARSQRILKLEEERFAETSAGMAQFDSAHG